MAKLKGKDLYLKDDDQIYFGDNQDAALWFNGNDLILNHTISGTPAVQGGHLPIFSQVLSSEEKFCWQIKLGKLRPVLVQEASSNFTPSGYDVYPVVANNWRTGVSSEFESGPCYQQTIVIKNGTPINFDSDGFMLYVRSTDVHSSVDQIQDYNPKMEYFKRIKYIQDFN